MLRTEKQPALCELESAGCFFWECRSGIYAYAGAGCLTQRTRACVPHTPYTSVLKFMSPTGRVCGAATHAVGGDAGCGLLRYYRFAGSLTTPPCTEGVSWVVLKSYDHIDQAQAEKFTRAIGSHNSRPVQPLNARVVIE